MNAPSVRSLQTLKNCGCAECKAELAYRLGNDGDLYRRPEAEDLLPVAMASSSVGDTDWVARHAEHMRRFPHSKATPELLREGATYDGPRLAGHPPPDPDCPIQQSLEESHIYE